MCDSKDWIFEFNDKFRESVRLGDNSKMVNSGKSSIKLKIDGLPQIYTCVLYF